MQSLLNLFFFVVTQQPLGGQSVLNILASWSHSVSKTPLDEWSVLLRELTTQNNHERRSCHRRGRTHKPSKRAAADIKHRAAKGISQYYCTVVGMKLVQVRIDSRDTMIEREREVHTCCCNTMHSNCDNFYADGLAMWSRIAATTPNFLFEWCRIQYAVRSVTVLQVPGAEMWAVW